MLGGRTLGAYCLSEPHCGSDAAALTTRAELVDDHYEVTGTKAWITHAGVADFYNLMVRTGGEGAKGISCLVTAAATPGMSFATPEHKMGMMASPTAQVVLDGARVPAEDLVGAPGDGFRIAMQALDAGRLGIAACAVGLARGALDEAVRYARERQAFGQSDRGVPGGAVHAGRHGHPGARLPGPFSWRPPGSRTPVARSRCPPPARSCWRPTSRCG